MNVELDRFLDSIAFDGRLALDGSVQRYGRKRNQWVWSIERDGHVFITAGDWSTGEKVHFGRMTHVIQRAVRQLRSDNAEKHAKAAERAQQIWEQLDTKPQGRTYLERKGVAGFGVRYDGCLVYVPMRREDEIVGLQRINPVGEKRFTSGCSKRGAYHTLPGKTNGEPIVLCEGYATGASICMATGYRVIVAFDCGNLMPVADLFASRGARIDIVAADNDVTPGNPGLNAAQAVALKLRARLAVPPLGMDFNDLHQQHGLEAIWSAFGW